MQNTIEIQERILYYNNQIDYCDNDINDLYKQISQLEDLSDRLILALKLI